MKPKERLNMVRRFLDRHRSARQRDAAFRTLDRQVLDHLLPVLRESNAKWLEDKGMILGPIHLGAYEGTPSVELVLVWETLLGHVRDASLGMVRHISLGVVSGGDVFVRLGRQEAWTVVAHHPWQGGEGEEWKKQLSDPLDAILAPAGPRGSALSGFS